MTTDPGRGAFERLRRVSLFDGMSDEDLERICTDVRDHRLEPGGVVFREGDSGDSAFVITAGDVEIVKATDRREVLLAVRSAGDVIGEMALLQEEPRIASARARTAAEVVEIPRRAMDEVLDSSPTAARAMFRTFLTRMRATNDRLRQSERMAQLGTLTAGVAHELNNPASAVGRAARSVPEHLRSLADLAARPSSSQVRAAALELVPAERPAPVDALTRSDAEAELEGWLEEREVPDSWELAGPLADARVTVADLDRLAGLGSGDDLADAIRLVVATTALADIGREIADGSERIAAIVRGLKSYSYLDQSPVQDVDVHQGLEDTLVLLAHKVKHVRVVRQYAVDLPTITAFGTELNQVWTNLIDNACDALEGVPDPTLTLRTTAEDGTVVVEIEDNGSGIAESIRDRVFDSFVTTKPPGQGTGLGLQISYRIVVLEHRGDITVESHPGRTVFRVTLPIEQPTAPGAGATELEEQMEPSGPCEDLQSLSAAEPQTRDGCPQCIALGDTWVHLRYCDTCGQVGCCDDSKNRHARAHAEAGGHPVLRSLEPGESWAWCIPHDRGIAVR